MYKSNYYLHRMHRQIYFILIIALAVSLPLSIFTTTLAEIFLIVNWISEGDFKKKTDRLLKNKSALMVSGIYIVHILWLINTSDFSWALHDLKIKLPVLVLPLLIASSAPFSRKELRMILLSFSGAVLISTLISAAVSFGLTGKKILDYREISIFISHIRLALMVVLSVTILARYASDKSLNALARVAIIPVLLWFTIYLVMLRSLTGMILLLLLLLINGFVLSGKITDVAPRFISRVLLVTIPLLIMSWISHTTQDFYRRDNIDFSSLDKHSLSGTLYFHDTINNQAENGHYVYLYIAESELRDEWNRRSELDYDGSDRKGQELKYTLFRYMTSKGLRKDANGMKKMSTADITAVEDGVANYIYLARFSVKARLYEVLWEIDSYRRGQEDPGGHSLSQRIIYLKGAFEIFRDQPFFGTGTGDIKREFNSWYKRTGAIENERWWYRAHNQYLTFLVTFGVTGFLTIMFFLFYPPSSSGKWNNYFFGSFAIIGFLSMLSEDTLETQTGVSFFMFFYSLFLFGLNPGNDYETSD